ncbi:MAG: aminopeptidase P family protein [Candidatus Lokiarchaeota archaeon]|nr:aminopeptidase P family protein [Candidatus Lokiarchaeota archaeon]
MKPINEEKFKKIIDFLTEHAIDFLLISDYENANDVNMQYLTGHPMDATVIVTQKGETYLVPWDVALAQKYAEVDEIFDLMNYEHSQIKFLHTFIEEKIQKHKVTVGLNSSTSFGSLVMFKKAIPHMEIFQEPMLISNLLGDLRTTKSAAELELLREAANIGNQTIPEIENFAMNATDETENDLDFFVRKKMASLGAEDVAFPTLVGSSTRAHNIHCHPSASNAKFATPGLALIDFGAKYKGYHSDITVPISFGELTAEQTKIRDLTQKAYDAAMEILDIGVPLWKVHEAAIKVIQEGGYNMPHSLGHGLGLATHDAPHLGSKPTNPIALQYWKETKAQNGMVFTIEPGVYKEGLGGQRLENDVIIWNDRVEVITKSRFITVL